jgi:hypothetical protein
MNEHWRYFQALEDDLRDCSRYVHFHPDNFSTYSTEFTRILLAAASEFDTVAKRLCREIDPEREIRSSIGTYREIVTSKYPRFPEVEIHVPRYQITFTPWEEWSKDENPGWWNAYNAVKHERDKEFNRATLRASLESISGLLIGLMYWFRETRTRIDSHHAPALFVPESYDIVSGTGDHWSYSLPGDRQRRRASMGGDQ